jgi:hypothetical protein
MPCGNDPYNIAFDLIEEPIWLYNHLTKGEIRELGNESPGFWEPLQARECLLCLLAKIHSRRRVIPIDISNSFKELAAARRGEKHFQGFELARKRSASFSTSSSS